MTDAAAPTPAAQPGDAKKKEKSEGLSPLKLAASGTAAVGSTLLGTALGDSGTIAGVFVGSLASGVIAAYFERGGRRAAAVLQPGKLTTHKLHLTKLVNGRVILAAGAITATALFGVISLAEASTGTTLHGIVTHTADYGTTLGGSSSTPPPHHSVPAPQPDDAPPVSSSPASDGGSGPAAATPPESPPPSMIPASPSPSPSPPMPQPETTPSPVES